MPLRSNLFIKVFLGFWLVSSVILGSWMLAARYFDSLPGQPANQAPKGPPRHFMLQLFYDIQNVSDDELGKLLKKTKRQHNIDIFLLTPRGQDIYMRDVAPGVARLAEQLENGRRRVSHQSPLGFMIGHNIYRDSNGPLRAVLVMGPRKPGLVSALSKSVGLRLALAILVSGLVCFALSRALTNRLKELQVAARQLAGGDLSTRIEVRNRGGDETDELARNFNTMAGQLDGRIKAQKQLLSDVSHELRSPLARLRIALALAEEDSANSAQHIQRIDLEAERLEALIAQLLSTQNEAFTADIYIDLVSLLTGLCSDATFEGKKDGKTVTFSTSLSQAIIPSHADLLKRCFENILRNALKYTANNTAITTTLDHVDDAYVIRIEDRGPGIDETELNNIFEEFYRVDNARQRQTGGYGLGLSIAKRAITQHRGTLSAVNTDTGLTVIATFPTQAT